MAKLKFFLISYFKNIFPILLKVFGIFFLFIESYEVLFDSNVVFTAFQIIFLTFISSLFYFFIDGLFFAGYLRLSISIPTYNSSTSITIKYEDILSLNGIKVIGVNDFFDHIVDNRVIAENSLHGKSIRQFWRDDSHGWAQSINHAIGGHEHKEEERKIGNSKRFPIGTTAHIVKDGNEFIFCAVGKTNIHNNITESNTESIITSLNSILEVARTCCSGRTLNIPLLGSGLSRSGIKDSVLIDIIVNLISEQTRKNLITHKINIILHESKILNVNLNTHATGWTYGK